MLTGWRGFVVAGVAAVLATAALLGVALADKRAAETGTGADLLNVDGVPSGGGAPAYESLFLAELNAAQDGDGSWSRDLNATALSGYAVAMDDNKPDAALESLNWTMGNYDSANLSYAAGAYLVLTSAPGSTNASYDAIGQDYNGAFRAMVAADLSAAQEANGSWGGDISSTALATYALAKTGGLGRRPGRPGSRRRPRWPRRQREATRRRTWRHSPATSRTTAASAASATRPGRRWRSPSRASTATCSRPGRA
jgi:hypothetical protein